MWQSTLKDIKIASTMSQTKQDEKLLEELYSSCCNKLRWKVATLSCGHTLCDRCFWETARETTIRECTSVKCKECGEMKETMVIEFHRKTQSVNVQSADKCQYFTACEIHSSKYKVYFCSDHGEALCRYCLNEHKIKNCNTKPIKKAIKKEIKNADDLFSDHRFKNVAECLCSVDQIEVELDLFYLKMKKRIRDCKERLGLKLEISIENQAVIKQVYDDVQRADHMVSQNVFTHDTLNDLLMIKNSSATMLSKINLNERAEIWPAVVAIKSKDFEHVLEFDADPIQLSVTEWSVYQSSSCVEDEESQPCELSDDIAMQSIGSWETGNQDSNGLGEYSNSFDASDKTNDVDEDYDDKSLREQDNSFDASDDNNENDNNEENVAMLVTNNANQYNFTKRHDVCLPNQTLTEQLKKQSNSLPRKDDVLSKSTDCRSTHCWELYSYEALTDRLIQNRDSESATYISEFTEDGRNYTKPLLKVKTGLDISSRTDRDTEIKYQRSTSEGNDAATVNYKAGSSKLSESKIQDQITSNLTTNRNLKIDSPTNSSHSSVQCKPHGETEIATETLNVLKSTSFSKISITAVNKAKVNQNSEQSRLDHNTDPIKELSQPNIARESTASIDHPGMGIRAELPQLKQDFTVRECIRIVISDHFVLTNNKNRLQKRRFEDSKLIEDTELSNMTSLCLVPSPGEISILQTNKCIRVYSADSSKWHFKANITLPYQSICCWRVEWVVGLDFWKSYVFVASYTNDIRQDCIKMLTINHYCSFPKSKNECECPLPRESVLLTSETYPCIRGVNSLDVMRRDQQLFISANDGLVCVKILGEESAEILWKCPFSTNISQIACDDIFVYVCVPTKKRVAKVSKDGKIVTSNILPTKRIVPDHIAVKENTALVGSFFHHDWTCKVYRFTF